MIQMSAVDTEDQFDYFYQDERTRRRTASDQI